MECRLFKHVDSKWKFFCQSNVPYYLKVEIGETFFIVLETTEQQKIPERSSYTRQSKSVLRVFIQLQHFS